MTLNKEPKTNHLHVCPNVSATFQNVSSTFPPINYLRFELKVIHHRQNFILSENQNLTMNFPDEGKMMKRKNIKAFFNYAFAKNNFAFAYYFFAFAKYE